ncbi:putative ribonuclease h protein, partial [Nicotiana attenuata]
QYLGYPILNNHPTPKDYQYIIENMQRKLSSWKANFLNTTGRTTLVSSTLNAIPGHAMHYTLLPNKILKQIDRMQRNFISGSTSESKKIHYISWNNITRPKEEGGLGITTAKNKNLTSLTNLAWKLLTNTNAPLSRTLIQKYATNTPQKYNSFVWKSILKGWSICSKCITWNPCKNSKLNIWTTNWIPNCTSLRQL